MEKATNSASFPITSEPHKSVVQIILPKNNNKSENLTQCSNLFEWIEEKKKKINFLFRRIIKRRNRRGSNISAIRKQKMREKIQPRYLEMEPLCCINSCLVRSGCHLIAFLDLLYVLIVGIAITMRLYNNNGHFSFWSKLNNEDFSYTKILEHQVILYLLSLFSAITFIMGNFLIYGLFSFERIYLKIHLHFDIISLVLNTIFFILYTIAIIIEGAVVNWKYADLILVTAFISQIPIRIWAIFVVKGCYDFYLLLNVFVTLAEK